MQLNIKYYGLLVEATNCNEEDVDFSKSSITELLNILFEKHPDLKGKDFQVAQNQEIVSKNSIVSKSEIALLPPFAGG